MMNMIRMIVLGALAASVSTAFAGLDGSLKGLSRITDARTRCISPENPTGEPGKAAMAVPHLPASNNVNNASNAARELGQGWKVNPYIFLKPGETVTLADIRGPGTIQHIWMTIKQPWRWMILRVYWDDEQEPSVEVPVADFFCQGWNIYAPVNSAPVCVNPGSAFNCYWPMPFRKRCRMTLTNLNPTEKLNAYYYIDYEEAEVGADQAYFHAQYRRTRYNETSDFTILDGVRGRGQFVGVYLAWGVRNVGWWGEGETKFFLDDDDRFPTLCSTGLEDYFCGSYNFDRDGKYQEFCTPYAGLCQVIRPDGTYQSQQRFGLYRWHILDPVRFTKALKMTIQDLGWRSGGRYLPQHSDISSTAFWYQSEPHAKFPDFPSADDLEPL